MQRLIPLFAVAILASTSAYAQEGDEPAPEPEAPEGWTCSAGFYQGDDGCDCGCGIPDPDCADTAAETCDYEWCGSNSEPDPSDSTACIDEPPPAEGWTCSYSYYGGDDGCDCGCGAPDPDCETNTLESCRYNYCEDGFRPADTDSSQCVEGEWTAPTPDYDDDYGDDYGDGYGDEGDTGTDSQTPGDNPTPDAPDSPGSDAPDPTPSDDVPTPDNNGQSPAPSDDEVQTNPTPTGNDGVKGCTAAPGEPTAMLFALLLLGLWRRRRS
jgi:uncharacterized protein (TIGR03382 family)